MGCDGKVDRLTVTGRKHAAEEEGASFVLCGVTGVETLCREPVGGMEAKLDRDTPGISQS